MARTTISLPSEKPTLGRGISTGRTGGTTMGAVPGTEGVGTVGAGMEVQADSIEQSRPVTTTLQDRHRGGS
jgi:hypothetical protein